MPGATFCLLPLAFCLHSQRGGQFLPVKDVRFENKKLIHLLEKQIDDTEIKGTIDWKRRFDHMQQHSGQHILSAAFYRLFEAATSSFHLGIDFCTIEISKPNLSEQQIRQAEDVANEVITSARNVRVFFADPAETETLNLRKDPQVLEDLRIIEIPDFDRSPCSGTHVNNTGEVGQIFIYGFEKLSQTLKITFLCGNRIRNRYSRDLNVLKKLAKSLTTGIELLPDSVINLQNQMKDLRKEISWLKEERLKTEAQELLQQAGERIIKVWDRPYQDVRFIAQKLSESENIYGALASTTENRVIFFKSKNNNRDLKAAFQQFLAGSGAKGGGPPHLMEAGGFKSSDRLEEQIIEALG